MKNIIKKMIILPISIFLMSFKSNSEDPVEKMLDEWPDTIALKLINGSYENLAVNKKDVKKSSNVDDMTEHFMEMYPNMKKIGPASGRYNCFSYAFICRGSFNLFWFEKPQILYNSSAYTYSSGDPGDIVIYFGEYGQVLHAGVVKSREKKSNLVSKEDLKNITVVSKRGDNALFEHKGDEYNMIQSVVTISYYKISPSHKHNYENLIIPIDNDYHAFVCSCGNYMKYGHMFIPGSLDENNLGYCMYCNAHVSGGIYVR